jgi:hypothetical protein
MSWLNFEDPRLALYEICFPNEYADKLIPDICKLLNLPFSEERFVQKLNNDGTFGTQCVYIEQSEEERTFLLLDCTNIDWLYTLCVICDKELHPHIQDRLLEWDNYCRKKYGVEPHEENFTLKNKLQDKHSLFRQIIARHRIGA